MLSWPKVAHTSTVATTLNVGMVCGNYYIVCTLVITDPGDFDTVKSMPEQTSENDAELSILCNINWLPSYPVQCPSGTSLLCPKRTEPLLTSLLALALSLSSCSTIPAATSLACYLLLAEGTYCPLYRFRTSSPPLVRDLAVNIFFPSHIVKTQQ